MPVTVRIIPCLDVADGRVVKGVRFQDLRDAGDPVELATRYYAEGADELTFLDVTASKENRSAILDVVAKTAESVFIPLTVGGGITSADDVARLLEAGADKISVGSSGISQPALLGEIADRFGSQVLVVSLDIKRSIEQPSGFTVTSHGGSRETGLDAIDWVQQVLALGAGELLVNSMDADGTREGFDVELIRLVSDFSTVPIIASGGAGKPEDFTVAAQAGADALLAASIFHNQEVSIQQVKIELEKTGHSVRMAVK